MKLLRIFGTVVGGTVACIAGSLGFVGCSDNDDSGDKPTYYGPPPVYDCCGTDLSEEDFAACVKAYEEVGACDKNDISKAYYGMPVDEA